MARRAAYSRPSWSIRPLATSTRGPRRRRTDREAASSSARTGERVGRRSTAVSQPATYLASSLVRLHHSPCMPGRMPPSTGIVKDASGSLFLLSRSAQSTPIAASHRHLSGQDLRAADAHGWACSHARRRSGDAEHGLGGYRPKRVSQHQLGQALGGRERQPAGDANQGAEYLFESSDINRSSLSTAYAGTEAGIFRSDADGGTGRPSTRD